MNTLLGSLSAGSNKSSILLHLPGELTVEKDIIPSLRKNFSSNKISLFQIDHSKKDSIKIHTLTISSDYQMVNDLMVVGVTKDMSVFLSAYRKQRTSLEDNQLLWSYGLSFNNNDILDIFSQLEDSLSKLENYSDISQAIEKIKLDIGKRNSHQKRDNIWEKFILDYAEIADQRNKVDLDELEEVSFKARFQEAVGWKFDSTELFNSMSDVLLKGIGFDYFELETILTTKSGWKTNSIHKQNLTGHGGDLLTLIIKNEKLKEILKSKIPIMINSKNDTNGYLANSRLLSFMDLETGLLLPLSFSNEALGLLKIFSMSKNHFTERKIERLISIKDILGKSLKSLKTHHSLQRMATIDALTNIFNRRFFSEHMLREFDRAKRYNSSLSLIMIDIDHFKQYNDSNGHLAGDKVLTQVASLLKKNVRGSDVVARYGGEEFVVILPETGQINAAIVAEKVREAIEKYKFKNQESQPGENLTISLGLASVNEIVNDATELINNADIALYEAKKTGRNRIVISNSN